MSYMIKTEKLTKVYGENEVVSNVSMRVKRGEIYGFLGPNGAGKTTMMKMLMNLVKPQNGSIVIDGELITDKSYEMLRKIGSVIEYPGFYDKLTGKENLELHCEYMDFDGRKAIDDALKLVDLSDISKKKVKEYSLGMKQRLGIARAILTKPEILILDEPINGLDPMGIRRVRDLLKSLSKEHGITILISSHIISEIEHIADTIGVINKGVLIEEITIDEYNNKNSEYIKLVVDNAKRASFVLDNELKLRNFKVTNDSTILIYDLSLPTSQISKALLLKNIDVEQISKNSNSLEDYFISLINGGEISA